MGRLGDTVVRVAFVATSKNTPVSRISAYADPTCAGYIMYGMFQRLKSVFLQTVQETDVFNAGMFLPNGCRVANDCFSPFRNLVFLFRGFEFNSAVCVNPCVL